MKRLLKAVLTLVLLASTALAVELPADLKTDFSPLGGVVVLATPAQALIDRDASHGVREGDLFAVTSAGPELIHPVSGEKLGRQQVVKGWLRVEKVRNGYAEATPLGAIPVLTAGERVERFNEAEGVVVDPGGVAGDLYPLLMKEIPHLRWRGYFGDAASLPKGEGTPRLVFTTAANRLEVREAMSGLLRNYPLPLTAPPVAAASVPAPLPTTEGEYWNGPAWPGLQPVGIEVVDIDGDGRQELLTASRHAIEVGRFSGRDYLKVASAEFALSRNLLGIDAADADGDGKPELWVTAERDGRLDSFVLAWEGDRLREKARNLPWWFRAAEIPGRGRTLLAQAMGEGEVDFSGTIVQASLSGGHFKAGGSLPQTAGVRLYGSAWLRGKGGEEINARLTLDDHLIAVSAQGEALQESDEVYGGSELFIPRPDPRLAGRDSDVRHAYLPARLETVTGRYLLAPANIGSRGLSRNREFKQSRLDLLEWDGMTLRAVRTGRVEPGWLVDFRHADVDNDGQKELVSLLELASKGFFGKGRTGLIVQEAVLPTEPR